MANTVFSDFMSGGGSLTIPTQFASRTQESSSSQQHSRTSGLRTASCTIQRRLNHGSWTKE
ncbi:hypothetical protein RRF57_003175 [Xylaria bambusicola]|uniref:Uncharacterized protein n=1 Tax=Xylaria bambusicola TaxID=326684 RepID=A0AAN7U8C3_9PEZI